MQVLEIDAELAEAPEESGDPGLGSVRVECEEQCAPLVRQLERVRGELPGYLCERPLQLQGELLLAELAHECGLVLDHDQLAAVDHAYAVGHLLRLLDVVRSEERRVGKECRSGWVQESAEE